MAASKETKRGNFRLDVPLDASDVGDLAEDEQQDLKVVAVATSGQRVAAEVALGKSRKATASLDFAERPNGLKVYVGPASASDEELVETQTLTLDVGARDLVDRDQIELGPVHISPYFWHWWLRWCREFVIRGRVVCPDGHPVPGAEVCASDVDWWFLWNSSQQVGCATTDENGAFEIRFRWCCGYWPWWWWRHRAWRLDPLVADRLSAVLGDDLTAALGTVTSQPSLETLGSLLPANTIEAKSLQTADVGQMERLRAGLLERLPVSPDLAQLHIWPWWPWQPWWDCTPDLIFEVTQECEGVSTVIVDENIFDARWNIPNPLEVVLVAESACCVPPGCENEDCGGECLVIDGVCGVPLANVGANLGAPATPEGYWRPGAVAPGAVAWDGDRPFGGVLTISKNPGDLIGVDYYEVEHWDGGSWVPLPAGAELAFSRQVWEPGAAVPMSYPLFSVLPLSGHRVYETREHRETDIGGAWYPTAGWDRMWLSHNYSTLARLDSSAFHDGTYEFRVVGWDAGGPGTITNPRVIPICGTNEDNRFVLTFDNRVVTAVGHNVTHNCGPIHICTSEPDTHILDVRINGVSVNPCDVAEADGALEIDFEVTDPDGHLARYDLRAKYGLSGVQPLLGLGTITSLSADPIGWTYGQAIAAAPGQGAVAPHWYGGRYRLRIENAADAFPTPCCYLLELRGWKRTAVGCDADFDHWNRTEYSIGIGVC